MDSTITPNEKCRSEHRLGLNKWSPLKRCRSIFTNGYCDQFWL